MIDLLVGGGGPAGLATALYAARAGLEVVVVERRRGIVDKACGEGLMPHAVAHLQRLGIRPKGKPFRGVTYTDGNRSVTATFRSGSGLGARRTCLHAALLDAVRAAGVPIVEADIGEVSQDATSVRAGELRARYLAAADGLHSPIRQSLGLALPPTHKRRWGIRRHVQIAPWSDCVEVYWNRDAEAYVTPVDDNCVSVAILSCRRGDFDTRLDGFEALSARIDGQPKDRDRAAGPFLQRVRSRTAGRILLVGDAAGYVDALTGEGLGLAFGSAELLVRCIVDDRPQDYDRQWRRLTRRYRLLTAGLLYAGDNAAMRPRIVSAAAAFPAVYSGLVNVLAG